MSDAIQLLNTKECMTLFSTYQHLLPNQPVVNSQFPLK